MFISTSVAAQQVVSTQGLVFRVLGVAVAYFLLGRLASLLAIPPGYAAPVWPAAGLAIAGVLLWGPRVWLGVFAGSLLVNLHVALVNDALQSVHAVAAAAGIAAGAALQALGGAALAGQRRWFGSGREVSRFLLTAGPIACLINATIGPAALLAFGQIAAGELAYTSWNWWIGDTIGVIVVAPLALIATGSVGARWRRRRLQIAVPMVLAVAVVVAAFVQSSTRDDAHVAAEFRTAAASATAAVERELTVALHAVNSLGSFFRSSDEVTAHEFRQFTSGLLEGHSELLALSWNRYLTHRERLQRQQQVAGFALSEHDSSGEAVDAATAADYVVVTYIEPHERNASAIGFNVMSERHRAAAIRQAMETGRATATAGLSLVQDGSGRAGVLLFAPVYVEATGTLEALQGHLAGFVTAVIRVDDLIAEALARLPREQLRVRLFDDSAGGLELGAWGGAIDGVAPLKVSQRVDFAGREWRFEVTAGNEFIATHRSSHLWLILAGGLLLSGMLGAFLIVITGNAVDAQQRHDELRRVNTELEDNVALRRAAEYELSAEKVRAEATLNAIADGVIAIDAGGRIEYMNPVAQSLTGWSAAEAEGRLLDEVFALHTDGVSPSLGNSLQLCLEHNGADISDELWLTGRDGTCYAIRQSVRALEAEHTDRGGYVIAFQDVTEARRSAREMARKATHDPLTGLVNRAEFEERLEQALQGARERGALHSVCFLDLDHFKQVNDRAGHATGDRLLRELCARIRATVRVRDTLARLGGDEFGLLLEHCPLGRAREIAADIVATVRAFRLYTDEGSLGVGVSIGVATVDEQTRDVVSLLSKADRACYAAKTAGRGRVAVADEEEPETAQA